MLNLQINACLSYNLELFCIMESNISRIELVYKHLKLTQVEFADTLGFSVRMIQNYIKGAPVSMKFISSLEKTYPSINSNYLREIDDNMLTTEDAQAPYGGCKDCNQLEKEIAWLKNQLDEKTDYIEMLKREIVNLKSKT